MIESIRRFLKNVSYNMLSDFSLRVGNYLLIIMISRMRGVATSGIYSISNNYLSIGLLFSYWGFSNLIIREISRDKNTFERYFFNAMVMRIALSVLAIIFVISFAFTMGHEREILNIIVLMSLCILPGSINHLIHAVFQAFEKIKYLSIVTILISTFKIIFGYIILRNNDSLTTIVCLLVICDYVTLIVYFLLLRKHLPSIKFVFNINFSLKLLKLGLPFFWIMLLNLLDSRTEIIIISKFLGEDAVGLLNPVNAILGLFFLFPEGVRYAILPLLVREISLDKHTFQKLIFGLTRFVTSITLPISIIVFFNASELINLIFTDRFTASAMILEIIIWTYISYSLNVIVSRLLIALNKEKQLTLAIFISAIVTIVVNLILVPKVGLIGVAFVRLATSLLVLLLCASQLLRYGYHLFEIKLFLKLVLTATVMAGSFIVTKDYNILIRIILGVITYIAGLFIFKIITNREFRVFKNLASENYDKEENNIVK